MALAHRQTQPPSARRDLPPRNHPQPVRPTLSAQRVEVLRRSVQRPAPAQRAPVQRIKPRPVKARRAKINLLQAVQPNQRLNGSDPMPLGRRARDSKTGFLALGLRGLPPLPPLPPLPHRHHHRPTDRRPLMASPAIAKRRQRQGLPSRQPRHPHPSQRRPSQRRLDPTSTIAGPNPT